LGGADVIRGSLPTDDRCVDGEREHERHDETRVELAHGRSSAAMLASAGPAG
jgi:hypothetical protein